MSMLEITTWLALVLSFIGLIVAINFLAGTLEDIEDRLREIERISKGDGK